MDGGRGVDDVGELELHVVGELLEQAQAAPEEHWLDRDLVDEPHGEILATEVGAAIIVTVLLPAAARACSRPLWMPSVTNVYTPFSGRSAGG